MLRTHFGRGAVGGSMVNTGELSPHVRRGIVTPFDGVAYEDGDLVDFDGDADLEIGGTASEVSSGYIFGRSGSSMAPYNGSSPIAEFLLYRFTLPIESIRADQLSDITSIYFKPHYLPIGFLWREDNNPKNGVNGTVATLDSVLIHTAQTPEELAMIPEPATWLLTLLGMCGAVWFAKRRRS